MAPEVTEYRRRLAEALTHNKDRDLATRVARLSVLFEDLRIESHLARHRDDTPWLDSIGKQYRYFYALRRMTVALSEFRGGLHRLNENAAWKTLRGRFDREMEARWADALARVTAISEEVKALRDSIGGHFAETAAGSAVDRLLPETEGVLTVVIDDEAQHGGVRLNYATEIVVAAMRVGLDNPDADIQQLPSQFNGLFSRLLNGEREAVKAMHIVAVAVVLDQFGYVA